MSNTLDFNCTTPNKYKYELLCYGYFRSVISYTIKPIVDLILIFITLCDVFSLISSDLFISRNKQCIKFIKTQMVQQFEYKSGFGNLLVSFNNIEDNERSITWFGKFKISSGNSKQDIYIGFTNFIHHMEQCPTDIEPKQGEIWLGFGINFYNNKLNVQSVINECNEFPFGEWPVCDWPLYYHQYPEINGCICLNIN